jgi:hypothetical protein
MDLRDKLTNSSEKQAEKKISDALAVRCRLVTLSLFELLVPEMRATV